MEDAEKAKAELTFKEQYDKISNTPEMAAILKRHGETYLEAKEGELGRTYTGKALNMLDSVYMEAMGLDKRPDGKTTDIIINTAKENLELKKQLEKLSNEKPEPKTINEDSNKLYEARIAAIQQKLDEQSQNFEALKMQGAQDKTAQSLAQSLQGANYNPAFGDSVLNEIISSRTKRLVNNSKEVDSKTIFYNEQNEPYMNPNGLPMSAKEVTSEVFQDLFFKKSAGGNAADNKVPSVKGDIMVLPNISNIKTFGEFNAEFAKAMQVKGWAKHEKRYTELQKATQGHYFPNGLKME
jgi:hypothetical protein